LREVWCKILRPYLLKYMGAHIAGIGLGMVLLYFPKNIAWLLDGVPLIIYGTYLVMRK